jgi:hypothetical protein
MTINYTTLEYKTSFIQVTYDRLSAPIPAWTLAPLTTHALTYPALKDHIPRSKHYRLPFIKISVYTRAFKRDNQDRTKPMPVHVSSFHQDQSVALGNNPKMPSHPYSCYLGTHPCQSHSGLRGQDTGRPGYSCSW